MATQQFAYLCAHGSHIDIADFLGTLAVRISMQINHWMDLCNNPKLLPASLAAIAFCGNLADNVPPRAFSEALWKRVYILHTVYCLGWPLAHDACFYSACIRHKHKVCHAILTLVRTQSALAEIQSACAKLPEPPHWALILATDSEYVLWWKIYDFIVCY